MKLPRAQNTDQAFQNAIQAIQTGKRALKKSTDANFGTEALRALNLAGKDILRYRAGLYLLPGIQDLHERINQTLGSPYYHREVTIDSATIAQAIKGVSANIHRIIQTVTHYNNDSGKVSHRYLGLMVQPEENLWDGEPALPFPPTNAREDQQLTRQHPVFPAETSQNAINRIKQSRGDNNGKAKLVQGVYWNIEALAAHTRTKLFDNAKKIDGQSALWMLDTRQDTFPQLHFLEAPALDLSGDDWVEQIAPHLNSLWTKYMPHPEDNLDSPVVASTHLYEAFENATGESFRIN